MRYYEAMGRCLEGQWVKRKGWRAVHVDVPLIRTQSGIPRKSIRWHGRGGFMLPVQYDPSAEDLTASDWIVIKKH